jgi:flagellar biosynthesis anti-sigma factor FlgM
MEIRNSAEALKALLGVSSAPAGAARPVRPGDSAAAQQAVFGGDHATFSQAATEASEAAGESGVRPEKVAAIQQALAAGTYSVPSDAVAGKVMDAMLLGSGS